ncbi:copper/silver efflux system, membrane fusion protein (plasmid) [Legionella adelaidensis]|uniref:Copper/silver efflux system, membrane fusion protein n=1 Tax=Legionella adelaidensis TaxID=45056 RepID=A0A0W0R5P0_9GAMM|nr:efflux RND transporter periplasmic adaptor subunit [Legionella adelaidensis]KTC66381.1 copper/silver efflux system, membrane fusion protein [Legionella adelaidensis]VEH84979.1 copper/silver efflux system, membrane fusion protein [Legionella adelaidensis]
MNKRLLLIFAMVLILGVFVGRWSMEFPNEKGVPSKAEKTPLYWIDAMEPTIHYPGPGKSRMGMELTPVYADENQDDSAIKISPTVINNMGVRSAPVKKTTLARQIVTVGYVEPNENQIGHIHTYADGWVKNLVVKTVGETVNKGQLLLEYYSPALVTAQEEYLIALESKNPSLIKASYKKLQALHISEQQIEQIKSSRKSNNLVAIYAPQDGIVTQLNIREGMRVTPDLEMMSLVDLSTVWIIAQIFEEQASWLHLGDIAEARVSAFPQKIWKGTVEYVYPQLDPMTRTIKVRFRFDNQENQLKPNMYVSISILAKPKSNILTIPLEALIRSSQGDRVIVALDKGRFEVRPVTIGMESGAEVEILSGLTVGENVVISGQFLIDSEANLKAGLERLQVPTQNTKSQQQSSAKNNDIFKAKGIIKALNIFQNTITIQHEPIPDLNWSSMTMPFSVAKNVTLKQFKVGDSITFTLQKEKNEQVIITSITIINQGGKSHENKHH